tara:strand:+ start:836 stop:1012 length:177 start_codon:yes stop_codon:yes gene_type:complete
LELVVLRLIVRLLLQQLDPLQLLLLIELVPQLERLPLLGLQVLVLVLLEVPSSLVLLF